MGERNSSALRTMFCTHCTWGTEFICYLEDLFVAEDARGIGAGRALINELIRFSHENGWSRLYWHAHEINEARKLYDSITPVDPFVRYVVKRLGSPVSAGFFFET